MHKIYINNTFIGNPDSLTIISGPCVIENEEHTMECAYFLKSLFEKESGINFIFKASYDKANRSSIHSYRGPGLTNGLKILEKIKKELNIPVLTDVHSSQEAIKAAEVCDIIQIPAFLMRQTDLLITAAQTGAIINIKKAQFVSPWDVEQAVDKIYSTGNYNVILTERGSSFGYNNLVSDMRSIPVMQSFGCPVIFDGTHSVQLPGALKTGSGGQTEFIPTLTRASLAAGCNGLFIESHPNPHLAMSDASSVMDYQSLTNMLHVWKQIYYIINNHADVQV